MMVARRWALLGLLAGVCLGEESHESIKSIPLRTHSLATPYLDSDMQSRWFDFGGDTIIRADQYIRLTSERPSQQGWLFSRLPLTATNWEIEVEFSIHGQQNLYGDGMAMWLTKQRGIPGPVFGSTDKFEGLGIFFDTYKNNRPGVQFPYVMAMLGDGKTAYDQNNDGKANELAGCSARGIRGADHVAKARLTYYQDNYLKLELQHRDAPSWTECFKLNHITIPSVAYLGFSAHTGELADNHDIIRVEAKNLYSPNPPSPKPGVDGGSSAGPSEKSFVEPQSPAHQGGSWGWFFMKLILLMMVLGGGYVAFTIWRTQRRGSRF
ncbi:MAG: camp-dependent protein kinase catalytic subunit [Watsoniomyces obsoletus]|nr:MAG: camp-dependent protein kinase catalytic subunit [Watsoniomyces obsoletus]